MTYFTLELAAGKCIEVCGSRSPADGALLGYAVEFAGSWDGWRVQLPNHRRLEKVAIGVSRDEAIRAVAEAEGRVESG